MNATIKAVKITDERTGSEATVVRWQVGIILTRWYDTSVFETRRAISDIELAIREGSTEGLYHLEECADLLGCTIEIERSDS